MKLAFLLSIALTLAAADGNVTGQWSGDVITESAEGQHTQYPFVLILKQEGNSLTGTMGPSDGKPLPVQNGKIESGRLTFTVETDQVSVKFELTLDGGHLKGKTAGTDKGQRFTGTLDMTRTK
jgi:hypothetical protein